jgi:hypothetical protein
MESKRATKERGTRISRIATATKTNTHQVPTINFPLRRIHAEPVSVITVPLASSVIYVVTQAWEPGWPYLDKA